MSKFEKLTKKLKDNKNIIFFNENKKEIIHILHFTGNILYIIQLTYEKSLEWKIMFEEENHNKQFPLTNNKNMIIQFRDWQRI